MSGLGGATNIEKLADLDDLKYSVESALESAKAANDGSGWLNGVQEQLAEALQGVQDAISRVQPLAEREYAAEDRAAEHEYWRDRI